MIQKSKVILGILFLLGLAAFLPVSVNAAGDGILKVYVRVYGFAHELNGIDDPNLPSFIVKVGQIRKPGDFSDPYSVAKGIFLTKTTNGQYDGKTSFSLPYGNPYDVTKYNVFVDVNRLLGYWGGGAIIQYGEVRCSPESRESEGGTKYAIGWESISAHNVPIYPLNTTRAGDFATYCRMDFDLYIGGSDIQVLQGIELRIAVYIYTLLIAFGVLLYLIFSKVIPKKW